MMRRFAWFVPVSLAFAVPCSVSCAGPAYRAAERGDLTRLRSEIATKHERGKVSNHEAACLSKAVLSREVETAKDEGAGLARVREATPCVEEVDSAFEARMRIHDAAGAEAALQLVEAGELGEGAAREYLSDPDERWRAVGTRTLSRDGDRSRRQAGFVDPSPRVRRSAIRAAAKARDAADLDSLFETARVDPELLLRNEALRAMSQILRADAAVARADEHVNRLRDLWSHGDDATREDVAVAWALSPVFEHGGRDALRTCLASGRGPGAIAAAGVVTRTASRDTELSSLATALLVRIAKEASSRDRLHAIRLLRAEGAQLDALRTLKTDDDREVRVAVLSRLADSKADHDAAIAELVALAAPVKEGSDVSLRSVALAAREVLARVGETRVQAWIEQDLAASDASVRLRAAASLADLGRPARAVMLLVDSDPSVRTRAACTMLHASRR